MRYLEQVISVRFPAREARAFLHRNLGNTVGVRLVEAQRGETVGTVRAIEVRHAATGEQSWVTGKRVLANGSLASFYVPDHLVRIEPEVRGASERTRILRSMDQIVLHVPVRGYLRFLPAIFQGEGPVSQAKVLQVRDTALARWGSGLPEEAVVDVEVDEDPIRRFLFLFQHVQTRVTDRIDRLAELIDPLMCEARFLPWLASWVGFELDESLPVHQQRELVRRAIRLYRTRGTRRGVEEMVRVLTSAPVGVRERVMPPPAVVGKGLIIGGQSVVERHRRNEPIGCYLYDPSLKKPTSFFSLTLEPRERFDKRFGERAPGVLRRIVHVVSQETPVHISFVIQFDQRG